MPSLINELKLLEESLLQPEVRCDHVKLNKLLHPLFFEVGKSGKQYTREHVIEHLLTAPNEAVVEATDYSISIMTKDCALLTYQSSHRVDGSPLVQLVHRSSLWVKVSEQWQLFYHQGTPKFSD